MRDGFVAEIVHEVGLPVLLQPWSEPVEQALQWMQARNGDDWLSTPILCPMAEQLQSFWPASDSLDLRPGIRGGGQ